MMDVSVGYSELDEVVSMKDVWTVNLIDSESQYHNWAISYFNDMFKEKGSDRNWGNAQSLAKLNNNAILKYDWSHDYLKYCVLEFNTEDDYIKFLFQWGCI